MAMGLLGQNLVLGKRLEHGKRAESIMPLWNAPKRPS
jgi:hypothetical protein